MDRNFRHGLVLLAGLFLLALAGILQLLLLEPGWWGAGTALAGLAVGGWAGWQLREDLRQLARGRRGEIALSTLGLAGILVAVAWLAELNPARFDMTRGGRYSLSAQSITMLKRIDKPMRITFFADPMMRETVDLYRLIARQNPLIAVEVFDPTLNPAQARMMGVTFAGTSVIESEGRKQQVQSGNEADIANAILRVSQGVTQKICSLEGHGEADPFSLESHDHLEGQGGHSHGLGDKVIVQEQHGMAKARAALETMNYAVEKITLVRGGEILKQCAVLVVAGPKFTLLPPEVKAIDEWMASGANALFLLDPWIKSGLEMVTSGFGIRVDDNLVIDEPSHFWSDISSPAVSDYNRHPIVREVPLSFFPGARSFSPTELPVPGTSVTPVANSSKGSWGETQPDRVEFSPDKDRKGPLPLMVASTRKAGTEDAARTMELITREKGIVEAAARQKQGRSRLVVVGDSDFATNSFFHILGNGKLFLNTINFLAEQENLIGIQPRSFDAPRVNLTNRQMKGTVFLSVILIPGLLALVGLAVWWRQR
jgi:ABC-type uncharacterized transport system involved in gliding motility auxiliary subunit